MLPAQPSKSAWKTANVSAASSAATVADAPAASRTSAISPKLSPGPRIPMVAVSPERGHDPDARIGPSTTRCSESAGIVAVEHDLALREPPPPRDLQQPPDVFRRQIRE